MIFQIRDHMDLYDSKRYLKQLNSITQNKKEKPTKNNKTNNLPLSLVLSWSQENNMHIEEVKRNSLYTAKWICPICGGTYKKSVRTKKEDNSDCPYCNNSRLLAGYNDLASTHPSLAKQWSPTNNFKPTQVMRRFIFEAYWICPVCHGEYKQFINEKTEDNSDCPYCKNKIPLAGFNDLVTTHPKLAKLLSTKNLLNAHQIVYNPNQNTFYDKFIWICPVCHSEYKKALNEKTEDNSDCPYCSNRKVLQGFNDLVTTHPKLAKQWSLNNDLKAIQVTKDSKYSAEWICPDCHGAYTKPVYSKAEDNSDCPYCSNRKVLQGFNDLVTTHPKLAKQWSLNNDLKAIQVTKDSKYSAEWICPDCHGAYTKPVYSKAEDNSDCPYCSNRKVLQGFNDLVTTHPKLAKQWSLNNDLKAIQVTKDSKYSAKWICPDCHGAYIKPVYSKAEDNSDCPYCNNKEPLRGLNTLYDKYPELLKEWAYEENTLLNIFPDRILPSSSQQVWWKCPNCNRKYLLSISLKVEKYNRNFESCTYCNGYRIKEFHYF